ETPWLLQYAAIYYSSDVGGYLRRVTAQVNALLRSPEFKSLKGTPWILWRAVIGYPSDPIGYLRGVDRTVTQLTYDPEFACFKEMPGLLRYAAAGYRSDARTYLRRRARPTGPVGDKRPSSAGNRGRSKKRPRR
ncbi:MAG: hypothetical protein L6Q93_17200, partial [Phycisphaerae bacterium]|nr:hypothetical protein [Phycisphaerae bacterium]